MAPKAPRKSLTDPGAEPRACRYRPALLDKGVIGVLRNSSYLSSVWLLLPVSTSRGTGPGRWTNLLEVSCGTRLFTASASHLWQLSEIPSAQAEASEDRHLPEGCSRASPLEEQLLHVKSSCRVTHVLMKSMGMSSVPSQVKVAAICHQFAQL